ncbi:hypothetical protein GA0074696_6079 [Micromonospora purpureochromogenes]|uniref:Uncharacterized protein n=1 Tax=Micromonospora purpureochromogenes TaxID=47872 RepID=A0A1C5AI46_9ACTN|nr:hypothetical protein [Micromonospora purpureochromogenes]SCF44908.1 hypothetical protein GA0074696_6079 [Micromonospora purpureochromogenes]
MGTATARPAGWCTRLLLLACTLLGLAAMHTIGHSTHSVASHPDGHAAAMSLRAMAAQAALPDAVPVIHGAGPVSFAGQVGGVAMGDCSGDGCGRAAPADQRASARPGGAVALPADQPGDAPLGWSVCLAVLGAFTVALLVATLLLGRARPAVATRHASGRSRGPRAPPPRPVGLRLATVSVLRR